MSNPIFNSVKLVQDFNRSSPSVAEQDDWNPPKSVLPHWRAKKRQHVRSNSFYAQRHFKKKWNKPRFLQLYSRDHLLKKQKLLCLWPLPTILGYTILLSLFISILSFINWYPVSCSSPTYVINRLEFGNLLLSPFLIKIWHMPSILMFAWNALLLGLLEESITQMLGSTLAFAQLLFGVMVSVGTLRQVLGYVFSKSTGYALPSLFFSDALHECNQGKFSTTKEEEQLIYTFFFLQDSHPFYLLYLLSKP
jgi:hypothetical protein